VRLGEGEEDDPTAGMTEEEREQYVRRKEANARALTLEMVRGHAHQAGSRRGVCWCVHVDVSMSLSLSLCVHVCMRM
jgi:hypothetical protein